VHVDGVQARGRFLWACHLCVRRMRSKFTGGGTRHPGAWCCTVAASTLHQPLLVLIGVCNCCVLAHCAGFCRTLVVIAAVVIAGPDSRRLSRPSALYLHAIYDPSCNLAFHEIEA
jgi:hypothetical protein